MSKVLSFIENSLLIFSASAMCIIAFANVLSRYFLNHSFAFTEEITINLFVLLTFVGAAVGVRNRSHLGFSLLYDKANLSLKKGLTIFVGMIVIAVFLIFTYYGVKMVQFQMMTNQTTPSLGWKQWIFSMGFPLGCLLCIIRAVESTVNEYKNLQMESE
ncbi:TRAP transporter small permease [Metabacillus iocasae]|uniref:C4-dicarboxylate transporter DctQ subunit n=1 Tax=Priestia iocasae TaxID=2291674 RepID=A0ABS2QYM2_9BACI|nr:TRAP transporter small permease [Metabacillus iocasae]MBM7703564.1 C4-dicarboxylate transporter DctQ subunit [Metabacillus iocasae]